MGGGTAHPPLDSLSPSASLRITCSAVCLRRFIVVMSSLPILGGRTRTTSGSDQGAQVSTHKTPAIQNWLVRSPPIPPATQPAEDPGITGRPQGEPDQPLDNDPKHRNRTLSQYADALPSVPGDRHQSETALGPAVGVLLHDVERVRRARPFGRIELHGGGQHPRLVRLQL